MELAIIQTGGTIDKGYPSSDDNHGYAFEIGEPAYISIMKRARLSYGYEEGSALKKDSLDMTDDDRITVRQYVKTFGEERIVLTHGTDTIRKTAEALSCIKDKTIVLTGADLPEQFKESNADFNLGLAIGAVHFLPPGIYIALYGKVVPWNEFEPR